MQHPRHGLQEGDRALIACLLHLRGEIVTVDTWQRSGAQCHEIELNSVHCNIVKYNAARHTSQSPPPPPHTHTHTHCSTGLCLTIDRKIAWSISKRRFPSKAKWSLAWSTLIKTGWLCASPLVSNSSQGLFYISAFASEVCVAHRVCVVVHL